jgi:hypothetical protein
MMGDGAAWIRKRIAPLYPQRVEILDWYHLSEEVWESAEAVYGSREHQRARRWVEQKLGKLWNGPVEKVHRSLGRPRQKWEETGGNNARALEAMEILEPYLREQAGRIDYPCYRKRGLPVGTGFIEGCARTWWGANEAQWDAMAQRECRSGAALAGGVPQRAVG